MRVADAGSRLSTASESADARLHATVIPFVNYATAAIAVALTPLIDAIPHPSSNLRPIALALAAVSILIYPAIDREIETRSAGNEQPLFPSTPTDRSLSRGGGDWPQIPRDLAYVALVMLTQVIVVIVLLHAVTGPRVTAKQIGGWAALGGGAILLLLEKRWRRGREESLGNFLARLGSVVAVPYMLIDLSTGGP